MRTHTGRNERGVALLVAMFALLLLSAIGMGMMFSANMETSIDANFRDKQIATYAALSGLQEARDRIQPATGDIASPADLPASGSPNIIYLLNPRSGETIAPWDLNSKYPDRELCHENILGLTGTADTPCSTIASGSSWYTSHDNGSSSYTGAYCASSNSCHCPTGGCVLTQPLLHKWVRIMLKADNMTPFGVNGTGSTGNQVCWNGTNQITRPAGYGPNCAPDGSITIQSFTGGSGYTSAPTVTISAPGAGGVQATATATVTITPTGQLSSITVTSPGSNYTTNTQVSITGGGGVGATALANVGTAGGQVNSVSLNSAGTGCYGGPAAPTVTFVPTGGGAGATATATLTGATCIYSISISGTCSAQANNNVSFTVAGGGGGGFSGTVTFKNNGSVKNGTTVITNPGSGYSSSPTSWSVSGCSGMSITSATLGYKVQSLNLTAGGNGYSTAPTVTIAPPPVGTTPTGTATVTTGSGVAGQVMSVTLNNPGTGYISAPTVTFVDSTGTGATAIASLATTGTVTAINLTNAGKGYTADPTITISGGGGTGATAVGTIAHGFTYGQVFELTSYAETPSGTRAMSQMEAVTPVRGFSVTGALTLDGPDPTFTPPNSLNMVVNGNDANTCGGVAQSPHPAVGVYDDPNSTPTSGPSNNQTAVQYVTDQVNAAKPANYIGAKPSPDIENVFGSLGDTMGTPEGLAAFNTAVYAVAHANGTNYGNNPGSIALGTAANPVIDFVDGDVTLSGANTGYGILLVTGNLTFGGNFNWNGPILVIGKGGFAQFNGGGNGQITGTVFVAKIYDSSGNLLPSLGSPDVTWTGGGGNGIQYDHCWADNMLAKVPFTPPPSTRPLKVLSTRTITY